jgi:hypothetical protein
VLLGGREERAHVYADGLVRGGCVTHRRGQELGLKPECTR